MLQCRIRPVRPAISCRPIRIQVRVVARIRLPNRHRPNRQVPAVNPVAVRIPIRQPPVLSRQSRTVRVPILPRHIAPARTAERRQVPSVKVLHRVLPAIPRGAAVQARRTTVPGATPGADRTVTVRRVLTPARPRGRSRRRRNLKTKQAADHAATAVATGRRTPSAISTARSALKPPTSASADSEPAGPIRARTRTRQNRNSTTARGGTGIWRNGRGWSNRRFPTLR